MIFFLDIHKEKWYVETISSKDQSKCAKKKQGESPVDPGFECVYTGEEPTRVTTSSHQCDALLLESDMNWEKQTDFNQVSFKWRLNEQCNV